MFGSAIRSHRATRELPIVNAERLWAQQSSRVPQQSHIQMMGDRADCFERARSLSQGKYPIYCQWTRYGRIDQYVRLADEHEFNFFMSGHMHSRWDREVFLVIRRASA